MPVAVVLVAAAIAAVFAASSDSDRPTGTPLTTMGEPVHTADQISAPRRWQAVVQAPAPGADCRAMAARSRARDPFQDALAVVELHRIWERRFQIDLTTLSRYQQVMEGYSLIGRILSWQCWPHFYQIASLRQTGQSTSLHVHLA